jgi:hypothetical protein
VIRGSGRGGEEGKGGQKEGEGGEWKSREKRRQIYPADDLEPVGESDRDDTL